jgi:hypothetical protein
MKTKDWRLRVGEEVEREWGGNTYQFRIGSGQQEANPLLRELESETPLKSLIEKGSTNEVIRTICFMSYYLINPAFDGGGGPGPDMFWFPLDRPTDDVYESLVDKLNTEEVRDKMGEEIEESEEDDEDNFLISDSDSEYLSTVGRPIFKAATSKTYINKAQRSTEKDREEILQEEVEKYQEEKMEEWEEWVEDSMREPVMDDFSVAADMIGKIPSLLLLSNMEEKKNKVDGIHESITNANLPNHYNEDDSSEELLANLTTLVDDCQALKSPAIEAFCIDEKNQDCQFHLTKSYGYTLDDTNECDRCGSRLYRVFRAGLDRRVKDAWLLGLLPELVVANTLQKSEWINEAIPHKMVQMRVDGHPTSSVEADIVANTKEDNVLFFEVTSQRQALDRVTRKRDKLEEKGIEFDGMVQVSPHSNDNIIPFGEDAIAMPGRYIPLLRTEKFKEEVRERLQLT